MALLKVDNISKTFRKRKVVHNLSLEVREGEIVGLLGKNGAGKTTTFKMIMGTLKPDQGRVYFSEKEISTFPMYKRVQLGLGYLAQESCIFRTLTVEQNILAILEARGFSKKEALKKTQEALEEMGIWKLRKSYGKDLSGGERKRLEIARVLSLGPKLVLLDEPFAAVDPIARKEIKKIVLSLQSKGISTLITDHNEREILSFAQRSYIMDHGEIITQGTTHELLVDQVAKEAYLGDDFSL
ncbi:MAG: LPS export ABC transporter ATP-binding protein [Planctomycetota bacterium]|nr:MAG: LPS export ABC transporter ATP-binding protein [Planctomycetota bacterium]